LVLIAGIGSALTLPGKDGPLAAIGLGLVATAIVSGCLYPSTKKLRRKTEGAPSLENDELRGSYRAVSAVYSVFVIVMV
jgi:hypothetical protein